MKTSFERDPYYLIEQFFNFDMFPRSFSLAMFCAIIFSIQIFFHIEIIELKQPIYFSRNLEPLRYSFSNKPYCHFMLEVKLVDWFSIVVMEFATALQSLKVSLLPTLYRELISVAEMSLDISKLF